MYGGRFNHRQYDWHATRIRADQDVWIETSWLLDAIQSNSRSPVPEEVLEYLRRRLEGDVPRRRGRPPQDDVGFIRNELIRHCYRRYLNWLTARNGTVGLQGWAGIRDADWWEGPPSERAARMTRKRLARSVSWQRVRQIASEGSERDQQ